MNSEAPTYVPISCEFHDILEAVITKNKNVQIRFYDTTGALQERNTTLLDVYARSGTEYLETAARETIRLDRLVAVDQERPDTH